MNPNDSIPPAPHNLRAAPPLAFSPHGRKEHPGFPALPALLATRLQLELLLSERSVDLRAAADVIRNDVGATLEIFRLAGRDTAACTRVEDCLAGLPTGAWLEAVSAEAVERTAVEEVRLRELTSFWERARSLAYACWLIAEHTEGVCPEQAYLVGLLQEAAQLPALLGWPPRAHTAAQLAAHWQLPELLRRVVTASSLPLVWQGLLQSAAAWSRGSGCLPCNAVYSRSRI